MTLGALVAQQLDRQGPRASVRASALDRKPVWEREDGVKK